MIRLIEVLAEMLSAIGWALVRITIGALVLLVCIPCLWGILVAMLSP